MTPTERQKRARAVYKQLFGEPTFASLPWVAEEEETVTILASALAQCEKNE